MIFMKLKNIPMSQLLIDVNCEYNNYNILCRHIQFN